MRASKVQFAGLGLVLSALLMSGCDMSQGQGDSGIANSGPAATATQTEDTQAAPGSTAVTTAKPAPGSRSDVTAELVLAGGCFWCMEAAFEQLRGVTDVVSGYAGGSEAGADYNTVSAGLTKHAESIRITYDPAQINEEQLLRVFFLAAHDPTEINRQFPDVGRQYRSAIFYTDNQQKQRAAALIDELNASGKFNAKIATTLEPLSAFYPAEDYHQDYVKHNPGDRYVEYYSIPRRDNVRKMFPELIRGDASDQ